MTQGADTLGATDRDRGLDGGDRGRGQPTETGWHGVTQWNADRLHRHHEQLANRQDLLGRALRTFDTLESGAKVAVVGAVGLTLRVAAGAVLVAAAPIAAGEWAIAHGYWGNAQHLRELQRTWLVGSTDQTQYENAFPGGVSPESLNADNTLEVVRNLTQQQVGVMDRIRYNRHQKKNWGPFRRAVIANFTQLNPIPKILETKPKPPQGDVRKVQTTAPSGGTRG